MNYMLMIYSDPSYVNTEEEMGQYIAFTAEVRERGILVAGEQLHPITAATSIRTNGGTQGVVTDGPFAETREFLGGFYLLTCNDLDEAIVYAKKLNAIDNSTVEIRPVFDYSAG